MLAEPSAISRQVSAVSSLRRLHGFVMPGAMAELDEQDLRWRSLRRRQMVKTWDRVASCSYKLMAES
jgi:hypothetical protein